MTSFTLLRFVCQQRLSNTTVTAPLQTSVKPILHTQARFLFVYPWSTYYTRRHVSCSYIRDAHYTRRHASYSYIREAHYTRRHASYSYIREAHITHASMFPVRKSVKPITHEDMFPVRISVTCTSGTHTQNYFRLHIQYTHKVSVHNVQRGGGRNTITLR